MKIKSAILRKSLFSSQIIAFVAVGLIACTQSSQSNFNFVRKSPPSPGAAAKIFGDMVTEQDLESENIKITQKRLEVYYAQKREVEERIRRKVFERLAADAKSSVDEYVKKEIERAKKRVSKKELYAFLEPRIPNPKTAPEHIQNQAKGIIHLQKLVANYTKKNPVELYLQRPRVPKLDFDFVGSASWGNDNAPVTIVEYSDFQCPFCNRANDQVVAKLKKKYGKRKIRIVFKHFPLSMHRDARPASEASMCINEQSKSKFWTYHDKLFDNQRALSADDLSGYAKGVGANMKKFAECVKSKKFATRVQSDFEEGAKLGVNSTPSFFINSQPLLGARPLEEFAEVIDDELLRAKN